MQATARADAQVADLVAAPSGGSTLPNRGQRCAFRVIEHGIDTVGFTYNGEDIDALAGLYARSTYDLDTGEQVKRIRRKGQPWLVHPSAGVETGYITTQTGQRLIHVEGRMSALAAADRRVEELASHDLLLNGDNIVRGLMRRIGIELPPLLTASVHRVDLAVDVEFEQRHDGLRFLAALDTLDLPSCKRVRTTAKGSSVRESVAWKNESGFVLRAYDKGYERSKDGNVRGGVIRLEAQRRPRAGERLRPSQLGASTLARYYGQRLEVFNLDQLVVTPPFEAYYVLQERIGTPMPGRKKDGSHRVLTHRVAERMLGTLMQLLAEGDAAFPSRRVALRRRRQLRRVGIVVDDTTESVIEIGNVIVSMIGAWKEAA